MPGQRASAIPKIRVTVGLFSRMHVRIRIGAARSAQDFAIRLKVCRTAWSYQLTLPQRRILDTSYFHAQQKEEGNSTTPSQERTVVMVLRASPCRPCRPRLRPPIVRRSPRLPRLHQQTQEGVKNAAIHKLHPLALVWECLWMHVS